MSFVRMGIGTALVAAGVGALSALTPSRFAFEGVSWTPPTPPRDDSVAHEGVRLPSPSAAAERTPNPVVALNQYSIADAVDKVSQSLVIIESSTRRLPPTLP